MIRFAIALLLLTAQVAVGEAKDRTMSERGHALVSQMCAQCHAIRAIGDSPHPSAPPFRRLQRLLDFNGFVDRLRDGLTVAHPDMPTFRFSGEDARAVAAYLSSIQQPAQ